MLHVAYLVEGGMGLVAFALAWLFDVPLHRSLRLEILDLAWSLVCTSPLVAALFVMLRVPWRPLEEIRGIVRQFVRDLIAGAHWTQVALLCLLAGLGEELLFRGFIQQLSARYSNDIAAVLISGAVFGLAHYMSHTYFLLATLVGWYFGLLAVVFDGLWVPIIVHSLYDYVALHVVLGELRGEAGDTTDLPQNHSQEILPFQENSASDESGDS